MAKKSRKLQRGRFQTFIIYPESLPENWVELLESTGAPIAISPLHDKDVYESDKQPDQNGNGGHVKGEIKKPHYHMIYVSPSIATIGSVRDKIRRLLGSGVARQGQTVENVEKQFAYLDHDSEGAIIEGKTKYDSKDVRLLNGFNINNYSSLSKLEKEQVAQTVSNLIETREIYNSHRLYLYLIENASDPDVPSVMDYYRSAKGNSAFWQNQMNGVYQFLKEDEAADENYRKGYEAAKQEAAAMQANIKRHAEAAKELEYTREDAIMCLKGMRCDILYSALCSMGCDNLTTKSNPQLGCPNITITYMDIAMLSDVELNELVYVACQEFNKRFNG